MKEKIILNTFTKQGWFKFELVEENELFETCLLNKLIISLYQNLKYYHIIQKFYWKKNYIDKEIFNIDVFY